jgi:hypothetical protein
MSCGAINDRVPEREHMRVMSLAAVAASAFLLFSALGAPTALAGATATKSSERVRILVRNSDDLVVVIRKLIAAHQYDAARNLIAAWHPNDATYTYRVRYVEGLIQREQGDYEAAIATFRGILAEKPGFSFVRIDLTQTLYLARDDEAAKYQAEMLIASGIDDRIGEGLKNIVGEIDRRRPIQFRAFGSILPSSNINNGTDRRVIYLGGLPFVIDDAARRKSGIGVLLGGDVLLRHQLNDTYALVGSAGLLGRMYPSIERTDVVANLSGGVERKISRGVLTVSAIGEQDYADMDAAFRAYGGRFELSRYVGRKGRVYGSLELTERDFLGSSAMDGWRAEFSGFYDRFVMPARFVRVLAGSIHEDTRTDAFSFDEVSGGLGFYNEFPMGLTLYAQAVYKRRIYDAPMAVFGTRKDSRYEVQATITMRDLDFHGLAPQLTYSFVRNVSTSPFDDYSAHNLDLRLVKAF